MTRHTVAFEIERPVPAAEAAKDLLLPAEAKASPSEPVEIGRAHV